MAAVTRSELMLLLSERIPGISAKTADEAVRLILEEMTRAVSSGRRIEIRGFGSFALNYRKGRNPRSGESVEVPAKYAVHFKAGKEMREVVDRQAKAGVPIGSPEGTEAEDED